MFLKHELTVTDDEGDQDGCSEPPGETSQGLQLPQTSADDFYLASQPQENSAQEEEIVTMTFIFVTKYLANGGSVRLICAFFLIGRSTSYNFVAETCHVLKIILSPLVLRCPSEPAHWLSIAARYVYLWNHPHCGGSSDATHIWIIRPPHGGSLFRNYKGFNSIILMTLSDADRRITWYCVGDYGYLSDSSAYSVSSLCRKLENNQLGFPGPRPLPGTNEVVPQVILADAIFPLSKNVMKPYGKHRPLTRREKIYNYCHSRGRMPVECQYGGLQEKWHILDQPLGFDLSVTNDLVVALVALHNFIINSNHPELPTFEPTQPNDEPMEVENYECRLSAGDIRERFADYFNVGGPGYLPWVERRIR
ncbi:hypothetical protein QAD02_021614 [Eretmocerus hayati]|uniref:Uncharacterized protein n=1 Tax=Eretmocerus hayati TaxID=131215 RepID=A0ACC2PQN5_9HYME|nr:hypothetical protein QAD02_021614 [Eretmocerus hayati]